MPTAPIAAPIAHVLIVAGPSGAGKSTFLRELAAGRLPKAIAHRLPDNADTWSEVWCNIPGQWQPFLGSTPVSGIAVHYDITWKWMNLDQAFDKDPFWDVLAHCETATIVNIRPSRRRLLRQWMHAHVGVDSIWSVYRKRALGAFSDRTLPVLRRLRTARPHSRKPHVNRYPRRIRFLRHVDRVLERLQFRVNPSFDFYCRPGRVERMLHLWDAVLARKLSGLPTRQIELTPATDGEIGKAFRWRIVDGGQVRQAGATVGPTLVTLMGTLAALC